MKKKLVLLTLVSVMGVSLLAGCGKLELLDDNFSMELGDNPEFFKSSFVDVKDEKELSKITFDFANVNYMKLGEYTATASIGKKSKEFTIKISDTTEPVVVLKNNLASGVGVPLYAKDMMDSVTELSGYVEVKFDSNEYDAENSEQVSIDPNTDLTETNNLEISANEVGTESEDSTEYATPNSEITEYVPVSMNNMGIIYNESGEYDNVMTLTDNSGNEQKVDIHITVSDLPVISNATDMIVQKGCNIGYMYGVSAVDNKGTDITGKIVVDSSKVVPDTVGDYEVTYTVTDDAGLTNTVTVKVSIVEDLLGSLEESSEGKRAVASNGTSTSEYVKQELVAKQNEDVVANAQGSSKNPSSSQGNLSNSNSNASSAPVASNPQIGFQDMEVASRTNGALNSDQKAYIDSLVRDWKSSKSNDQDLYNTIIQYLADNGVSSSFGTAVTDDKQLVPSWEYMKEISQSTGGIYDYYYVYTNGDYSGGMLICYKTYVDIF